MDFLGGYKKSTCATSMAPTLNTDEQMTTFIEKLHNEVVQRHKKEKEKALCKALKESRDAVIQLAVRTLLGIFLSLFPAAKQPLLYRIYFFASRAKRKPVQMIVTLKGRLLLKKKKKNRSKKPARQ